jgi:shikimate dehydrogenase
MALDERVAGNMLSDMAIYALIGNPVGHSLSPLMHNCAYEELKLSARYVPFRVFDLENALRGIKALQISGVSVTIPFKVEVMKYVDELDGEAEKIGAVNTISNREGKLIGHNTDWRGILQTLQEVMEVRGRSFVVLGAGGTAQAAIYAITTAGGHPIIVNRTAATGRSLALSWGIPFYPLADIGRLSADCLINTTPVGMYPHAEESPVPAGGLNNFRWVMDVIYRPLQTRLLREAEKAGCGVLSGLTMFVHQGAEQISLWTGKEPPRELMREIVKKHLGKEQ